MKEIPLTRGKVALVDDEDYDTLNQVRWQAFRSRNTFYAHRHDPEKHSHTIAMHRSIMDPTPGFQVDHKNRDGLDNRRANLRVCSFEQNTYNRSLTRSTSGYKGCSYHIRRRQWQAYITVKQQQHYLGLYATAEDAARAYDAMALVIFGDFALLNFPKMGDQ